jgi:transketolase
MFNKHEYLEESSFNIRKHIVQTIINHGEGHGGPALSCADIMAVLYKGVMKYNIENPCSEESDKFIMSAGHKCLALYGALVDAGIVSPEVLETYNSLGSPIPGHPDMKKLKGVHFSTGSLGHGLPIGLGMAKGIKLKGGKQKVYVLMGDGEQGEGSIWEAAAYASHNKLDNVVAIIDRNRLQINGTTDEVLSTSSLEDRYSAFGWSVRTVDGHSLEELYEVLSSAPFEEGKPSMIIANTIKSKGLSFAENNRLYHHWHPDEKEANQAIEDLKAISRGRWSI